MSTRPTARSSGVSKPASVSTSGRAGSLSTAPRSSVGAPAPRTGMNGAAPRSSVGAPAPRTGMNGAAPRSSVGAPAPRTGMNGAAPRSSVGGAAPPPAMGGPQSDSFYGGMGPRTGSMRGSGYGGMGGPQSDSFYGGMGPRTGSMRGSGYGGMGGPQPDSFYGGMGPRTGSMRGSGYGGMGGPQPDSFYGGMGPRTGSMRGSSYRGSGYGMQGMGMGGPMGSGYGGFGSMRGFSNRGSMYGMGAPMGMGSMYGMGAPMGMGSMYGMGAPMGMGSMYGMGGPMGMGMGSMYGMGGSMYGMGGSMYSSIVDGAMRRDGFLARNNLVQAKVAPLKGKLDKDNPSDADKGKKPGTTSSSTSGTKDTKSSTTGTTTNGSNGATRTTGTTTTTTNTSSTGTTTTSSSSKEVKSGKEEEKATPKVMTSSSLQSTSKPSTNVKSSTTEEAKKPKDLAETKDKKTESSSKEKAKPPTDTNIHSLVVITKEASSSSSSALTVKDATTVTAEKVDFTLDEVLTHTNTSKYSEAVMLEDLRRHWLAGHNSTLLLGASKGQKDSALELAEAFLSNALNRVEKDGTKFDVCISMAAFKNSDEAMDLLKSGASYEKVKLGSSPVFGPAIADMTTMTVTKPSECVSTFKDGIKKLESSKLAIAFFVLKQVKKAASGEETVYLSSLGIVFAGEHVSHFTALKEKSKSEPCTLLRYAIGGASVTVCMLAVSADGKEKESVKSALEVAKAMREVKNSPPRSGNVKHFVDYTEQELPKHKENAEKNKDNKAKYESMTNVTNRMEKMLKDAKSLLSKPMGTKPPIYV